MINTFGASDYGGSLLHNKPFDYVMARPECTDLRARYSLLSGDFPALDKGGELVLDGGVFWLLGEEILHKERRDFVRRQNRGVRKICRRKKTKVSRPLFLISWPKAGILLMGGLLILCCSLRKHNDNSPILYAH